MHVIVQLYSTCFILSDYIGYFIVMYCDLSSLLAFILCGFSSFFFFFFQSGYSVVDILDTSCLNSVFEPHFCISGRMLHIIVSGVH